MPQRKHSLTIADLWSLKRFGAPSVSPDGLLDIFHVVAQGIVAGANMVLVDFHPNPAKALVDGPQALLLSELEHFLGDAALARETYLKRSALAEKHRPH